MRQSSSTLLYEYPPTAHSLLLLRSRIKQTLCEAQAIPFSRVLNDLAHLKEGLAFLPSSLWSDPGWWSWVQLLHPRICSLMAAGDAYKKATKKDQSLSSLWSEVLLEIYYQTLIIESELEEQVLLFYNRGMYISDDDQDEDVEMSFDDEEEEDGEDEEEEEEEEEDDWQRYSCSSHLDITAGRKRGERVKSSLRIILMELGLCEGLMTNNNNSPSSQQLFSLQDVAEFLMLRNSICSNSSNNNNIRKRDLMEYEEEEVQRCVKHRRRLNNRLEQQRQQQQQPPQMPLIIPSTINWKPSIAA